MDPSDASLPPEYLTAQMGWVRELARNLVSNPSDADDVSQEVWLAATERPPKSASNPRAWLATVTKNIVRGKGRAEARRRRREALATRAPVEDADDGVLARGESCQRVVAAVMALDEPYRSTVLRRYLDGLSTGEIAARDGVSEPAVRKRLSRAMQQLRAELDTRFEGGRATWVVALVGIGRAGRPGAAPALGATLGGLIVMKKALGLAAALALLLCVLLFTPVVREWLGLQQGTSGPKEIETAATVPPSNESAPTAPTSAEGTRTSLTPAEKPKTIAVDGIVLNLPYPDSSRAPTPAAGVEVSFWIQVFDSPREPSTTRTGADGRFHLEIADPGRRPLSANVVAEGDGGYRPKIKYFQVEADTKIPEVRLERAAHGDLLGVVVDDEENPLAGVTVQLGNSAGMGFMGESPEARLEHPDAEVTTDASGAFAFRNLHASNGFDSGAPNLVAIKPGFRTVPAGSASPMPTGGWNSTRIRMLATGGQLIARVHDDRGRPEVGAQLGITLSKGEPAGHWEGWNSTPSGAPFHGDTDASGRVVLNDLWIGKRLELEIATLQGSWTVERASSGRIDVRHSKVGSALVVRSSTPLELEIVLPSKVRLRGRVVDGSGAGVPNANVSLHAQNNSREGMYARVTLNADASGAFEQELMRPAHAFPLEVCACSGPEYWAPLEALPYISGRLIARQVLEVAPDSPDEVLVQVIAEPALTLSGTVHEVDGSPCVGRISAIPVGASESEIVRGAADIGADGHFEFAGLLPGSYDLEVWPMKNRFFSDCPLTERFHGFASGSSGVALVLGVVPAVNVEVDVTATDGKLTSMGVVTGVFLPYTPRDPSGHVPDPKQKFTGNAGWPPDATLNFGGQSGAADEQGITSFMQLAGDLPLHKLKPMNPGWYWIGIDGFDAAGERYHPCGTGLVHLTAGSYHFHFDLVRDTHVEGRITNAGERDNICVGLVTREGRAVQVLRTNRHLDEVVSLGEGGRFEIEGAPVGDYVLRVGTEQQLRAGEFIQEVPVTISPKDNAPIVVPLH